MEKYPLTEQEEIDLWYCPSMHVILKSDTRISNYTVLFKGKSLRIRLFMRNGVNIELPIPKDAEPGKPWPGLQVVIKLNQ